LHALGSITKTEILSRPSILTRNNQQATIMVGQSVPLITNSRVSEISNSTLNTVQYQDVGIILRVTPFITAEGLVEMIVTPEISSLSATTVPISSTVNSPVIDKRSADTVVVTAPEAALPPAPSVTPWTTLPHFKPPAHQYRTVYGDGRPVPEGARTLPYNEGDPPPYRYHLTEHYRGGLIIGGAISLGVCYAASAMLLIDTDRKTALVPIVGPLIEGGRRGSDNPTIALFDGLCQIGGATMLAVGLLHKKKVWVRDDFAQPTVRLTPLTMGYGGVGLGLVGTL
jgi:hypothetical protein